MVESSGCVFVCGVSGDVFGASTSRAQTFRGSILGTVTDSSGAALVGATVTAHNVDTGVDRITETTTDGGYLIPELPVGTYNVTVDMKGFQKTTTTAVTVTVAGRAACGCVAETGSDFAIYYGFR